MVVQLSTVLGGGIDNASVIHFYSFLCQLHVWEMGQMQKTLRWTPAVVGNVKEKVSSHEPIHNLL